MSKKNQKKKRNTRPIKRLNLHFKNTIMLNIMIVMLILLIGVIAITSLYLGNVKNMMQTKLPENFMSSLKVFDENKQSSDEFEANLPQLKDYINSIISKNYNVEYIVVAKANNPQKEKPKGPFKQNEENSEVKNLAPVIYSTLDKKYYTYDPNKGKRFNLASYAKSEISNHRIINVRRPLYDKPGSNPDECYYDIYLIMQPDESNDDFNKQISLFFLFVGILTLLSLILVYLLARSITKPLSTMEQTVSKIEKGDLSGRLDYTKYYEINQLVQSYNMMANTLQRLYSSLEKQVQDRTKELKNAYAELKSTQAMMVHSEKMKSLGELVAGIMHEINNPINFIYGNMTHLSNYSNDLIQIIEEYTKYNESLKPEEKDDIEKLKQDIDYDFLKSDLPDLIKSCKEGADRAKNIIQDLKSFSRMEGSAITDVDVEHEIDTTLNILHNKLKNKAEIHKEYMENVPKIEAFGGQLNQVFMNILDNAAGAIKDHGDIWIRINTDSSKKNLVMEIEDNGEGMDAETASKIFDPFFTTKPVGQGTGLGLSITHKIIKNHQGNIRVESQPNLGTKFIITLPINIDRENLNAGMISGETNG